MNKNNFLPLIKFTLFSASILFAIDFAITFGAKKSDRGWFGKINTIVHNPIKESIVVFGSSVGEVGIIPKIIADTFSTSTYNYSIDGTPFIQYEGLINQFIENNSSTKCIILAETFNSLSKKNQITEMERYLAQINNPHIYNSLHTIQPDLAWKCRYVPFYKYVAVTHNYYLSSIKGYMNYFGERGPIDSLLGYIPHYREWESDADEAIRKAGKIDVVVDSAVKSHYIKTIKNITDKNIKVFIILMPTFTLVSEKYIDLAELRTALTKIAELEGVTFLDATKLPICNEKTNFYNSTHLNFTGSTLFTKIISSELQHILK